MHGTRVSGNRVPGEIKFYKCNRPILGALKWLFRPYSYVFKPYSDVLEPYSGVFLQKIFISPHTKFKGPYSGVFKSYSDVLKPYSGVFLQNFFISPHTKFKGPYCGVFKPYSGVLELDFPKIEFHAFFFLVLFGITRFSTNRVFHWNSILR